MINLPLLGIDFAANALMIMTNLLIVANFDIPFVNMDDIFGPDLWDLGNDDSVLTELPNSDLLQAGYNNLGYNTRYIVRFLGSVFIFFNISLIILTIIGLTKLYLKYFKKVAFIQKIHDYLCD